MGGLPYRRLIPLRGATGRAHHVRSLALLISLKSSDDRREFSGLKSSQSPVAHGPGRSGSVAGASAS